MARPVHSVPELARRLRAARPRVDAVFEADPLPVFASMREQLAVLEGVVAKGTPPDRATRDRLSFGLLASQHLHETDPDLAEELYALASWVTHWR
jgi:hypothetical protein